MIEIQEQVTTIMVMRLEENFQALRQEQPSKHNTSETGYNPQPTMAQISGTKLGPYEIVAPLGASGALDSRLRRKETRKSRHVTRPRLTACDNPIK